MNNDHIYLPHAHRHAEAERLAAEVLLDTTGEYSMWIAIGFVCGFVVTVAIARWANYCSPPPDDDLEL